MKLLLQWYFCCKEHYNDIVWIHKERKECSDNDAWNKILQSIALGVLSGGGGGVIYHWFIGPFFFSSYVTLRCHFNFYIY
jgi:hypothetical protein